MAHPDGTLIKEGKQKLLLNFFRFLFLSSSLIGFENHSISTVSSPEPKNEVGY